MFQSWLGVTSLTILRKKAVLWTLISFVIYFSSVVAGSIIQKALVLNLQMGWGQHVISTIVVLIFASFFKKPQELLGLSLPKHNKWLLISLLTAMVVIVVSVIARSIGEEPVEFGSLEYYVFQATMPGIGEELGLRGLVLGFLLYYAKQHNFSSKGIWTLIVLQALPFGFLHLFQTTGMEAVIIFTHTTISAIALGWLRAKTDSIIPSILVHNIINVFGSLSYYYVTA